MGLSIAAINSPPKQVCTPHIGVTLTTAVIIFTVFTNGMAFPMENQRGSIQTVSMYRNQSIQSYSHGYNGTTINLAGSFNMRHSDTIKRLQSFLELNENWNGYGACVFSHQLVQRAIEIVQLFPVQPEVYPISNGSIQFEFEKPHGEYLEFEIGESQNINVFRITAEGSEQEYQTSLNTEEIVKMVKDFYG